MRIVCEIFVHMVDSIYQPKKGFAPILNIEINQSGDFVTGKTIPIKQINRGYVYYDKEKKAINKIKELTKLDFPDSLIEIDHEGNINIK